MVDFVQGLVEYFDGLQVWIKDYIVLILFSFWQCLFDYIKV